MHRKFGFLLVFIVLTGIGALHCQSHFFRKFDSRQGLPSSEVYHAIQDDKGYMWFSTDHGLVRYDGYRFRTFDVNDGLPENTVFTLYKDNKNRVWFGTLTGRLGYHDGDRIYNYRYNENLSEYLKRNTLNNNKTFTAIAVDEDENLLLAIPNHGLIKIDQKGIVSLLNPRRDEHTLILVQGPEGSLLVDHPKKNIPQTLIIQHSNNKADTIGLSSFFVKRNFVQHYYYAIKLGENIYFSQNHNLFHFRFGQLINTLEFSHPILKMGADRHGRIWILTKGGGGHLFDKGLNKVDVFLEGEPLSSFWEDHERGLWFTSLNSGIFYIPESRNRVIVPPNMTRQEKINDLETDRKGRLWFSSFNLFGFFDGDQSKTFTLSRIGDTVISQILPDPSGKHLWIGTNRGLFMHDCRTGKLLTTHDLTNLPYLNLGVKSLFFDTLRNNLWVGLYDGVYTISSSFQHAPLIGQSILNRVEAIAAGADNTFYFGSQNGLFVFDGENLTQLRTHGLGPWRITSLKWRNDSLWIGSREKGLLLLTPDTLLRFGTQEGLLSMSVNFIELQGAFVVAGTNKGISVLGKKEPDNKLAIIQNITAGYGLLANEVSAMTINRGKIIAASAGFISFLEVDPNQLGRIRMPLHITSVRNEKGPLTLNASEPLRLKHDENNVSFSYFAISFFLQGQQTYRHRLNGLEKDWVVNQQSVASYPYLPPGQYTFEVQVKNPDGTWSSASQIVAVEVLRPFWQTWWFVVLMLFAGISVLLGLFYAVSSYWMRQRNMANEIIRYQQESLALQMNPHFLFNALNTVQRYILENDKMASSRYLTRFAGFMRSMLENAQKSDTSIAEEIQLLSQYLELESARKHPKFSYQIDCDDQIDTYNTRIPVFLIQPLIENAITHGLRSNIREGKLHLTFTHQENNLLIKVHDNGIGREAASKNHTVKKTSLGLSIIQKRISLINKSKQTNISLEIVDLFSSSGEAAGTLAMLYFPHHAKLKTDE